MEIDPKNSCFFKPFKKFDLPFGFIDIGVGFDSGGVVVVVGGGGFGFLLESGLEIVLSGVKVGVFMSVFVRFEKTVAEMVTGCLRMMKSCNICMKITKISFKLLIK